MNAVRNFIDAFGAITDRLDGQAHGLVDEHFGGGAGAAIDRRMWRHLRRCQSCLGRYRSRALLETLEPDGAERARRRLGQAVFAPRRRARAPLFALGLAVAAAAVLLLVLPDRLLNGGFQPRGETATESATPPGAAGLVVFRIPSPGRQGPPAERVGAVIRGGDGLAFSYLNPPEVGATHLMVFAVDGAGRVYWFWPEWRSAGDNPTALPIQTSATPIELPEGVRHDLPPGPLTLYALFARRPHQLFNVRQVEAAVAGGEAGLRGLDGMLWSERLEVAP
jgi:hypothetical protein